MTHFNFLAKIGQYPNVDFRRKNSLIDVEARLPKNRLRDFKQMFRDCRDCLVVK